MVLTVVVAMVGSLLWFAPPASAEGPTTTELEIGPSDTTQVGEPVTFKATLTPAEATGTVQFRAVEGNRPISGFIPVVEGVAEVTLNNFATGTFDYYANFTSEEWDFSSSDPVTHTIEVGDLPVMECTGGDPGIREILEGLQPLQPSGGVVVIETPIIARLMDPVPNGPALPVSFDWNITIPDYLVDIAAEFGAEDFLSIVDIDVAIEASGAATGSFNFPELYPNPNRYPFDEYIPDPSAPIILTAAGGLTPTGEGEITYAMAPEGSITVVVPEVGTVPAHIEVILNCDFLNAAAGSNEVEGEIATPIFNDVGPADPFDAEINWMYITGLSTGYEPGPEYRPTATLTRQAMSAFIYRINGEPDGPNPECETIPFPDVSLDNDFCGEIQWMKDEGITTGNEDGTFNPTGGLSRQAMSAFLYRSFNGTDVPPPACTIAPFPDVPTEGPGSQFCPYITWMAQTGISTGFDDGEFKPNQDLTRQAMSAFLFRYSLLPPLV